MRWRSCGSIKAGHSGSSSGNYIIDPDGKGGVTPFSVYCDMSDKGGVGVTVISHDSESRTHVVHIPGCGVTPECYCCYTEKMYLTLELAQLNWRHSLESHKPVNSLLNLNATMMLPLYQTRLPGGCHVMEGK